ncbi:MAG: S-methyl-5-thioribose kinase [Candidatus Nanopelagicaceae bacterium]|nr:S-methyl-5-thioribose kinase [Candidatus Nanopelagicaceae bacterium]
MEHTYEFLSADNIPAYLASRKETASIIDPTSIVEMKEVGDGNLNIVFIVKDSKGQGIVLKQALPYVRLVGPSWPMSPDRARIEYETTVIHSEAAKHLVPKIYFYDTDRYIIAMEDLSDHKVWRTALNAGEKNFGSAESVGEYIARVTFATSIFGAGAEKHKKDIARAINPEICLITEDLVFTEPYFPGDRNSYLAGNEPDAQAIIDDKQMVLEMGELKFKFMTAAEALIHGDLHTGSVMVKSKEDGTEISTRAFDSEFSFYGPIAFDIGAVIANFYIAMARSIALGRTEHVEFIQTLPTALWSSFETHFRKLWPTRVDKRVFSDQLLEVLLEMWKEDAFGFAAAKMARRIVGLAKTTDIETLDPSIRVGAARGVLRSAQLLIRERHTHSSIDEVTTKVREIMDEVRTGEGR